MQKVTVIIDGVEKELVLTHTINGNRITINGQSYSIVDKKDYLGLDCNGNKIFKGDRAFAVHKTTFNKSKFETIEYHLSNFIERHHLFTTEEAADNFIKKNRKPHLCLDYNGNKIFKGDYIFVVNIVNFYKYVIEIDHIGNEHSHYFTTEKASDEFIKANKPFTIITHDGFEVKEGDNVVIVNLEMRKVQSIANKNLIRISSAIFSTDIAADNYIRENKVCLSLAMVIDELKGGGYTSVGLPRNRLSVLVDSIIKAESKLKTQVMKIS